jgi:hypothetical protein
MKNKKKKKRKNSMSEGYAAAGFCDEALLVGVCASLG